MNRGLDSSHGIGPLKLYLLNSSCKKTWISTKKKRAQLLFEWAFVTRFFRNFYPKQKNDLNDLSSTKTNKKKHLKMFHEPNSTSDLDSSFASKKKTQVPPWSKGSQVRSSPPIRFSQAWLPKEIGWQPWLNASHVNNLTWISNTDTGLALMMLDFLFFLD